MKVVDLIFVNVIILQAELSAVQMSDLFVDLKDHDREYMKWKHSKNIEIETDGLREAELQSLFSSKLCYVCLYYL